METATRDRVTTEAVIESQRDLYEVDWGIRAPENLRRLTIPNALADTGVPLLSLPPSLIQKLGLKRVGTRWIRTNSGTTEARLYDPVRLTIQGRTCTTDVQEAPEDSPVLIGQVSLGNLDLVVDPQGRKLTGNPLHGGEHMCEMY